MKVLFVNRGFGHELKNPVVDSQAKSLIKHGVDVDRFVIPNGGLGYLKAFFELRSYLKNNKYDLIHGHYSYCAIIASLAAKSKVVASLMVGDTDPQTQSKILIKVADYFANNIWDATIVKSDEMKLSINKSHVIPNGVNFERFKNLDKNMAIKEVGFKKKINIIFIAQQPENHKWKNLSLARKAVEKMNDSNVELHILKNINQERLPYYYSAADVMLQTSSLEGSPNVIKEAMACCCPIVSTDVGDTKQNIGNTKGCFLTSYDVEDITEKLRLAISFGMRTNGRKDIDHLNDKNIARQIVKIYQDLI